jgi:hypothetical protein
MLLQASAAVLLSVPFFLLLIVVHRPFPPGFSYPEQAVSRWALYVCVLLTFWSLASLFGDGWQARKRERSIAGTALLSSASLASEEGIREVMESVRASAARFGDGMLAYRIESAIARFQSSHSAVDVAEELAVGSNAAFGELEASHAPVRMFLYAIPILGFAGTVMGIRQILEQAAGSPSPAAQQLDAIRVALVRITASLAGSFDTSLLAVVMSLVVMVALTWVVEKEKRLLAAIEEFCRVHLIPLMQPVEAQPNGLVAREEALVEVLTELRSALNGMMRSGNETGVESIEKLRSELSDAWSQHFALAQQDLEQKQARSLELAQRFDELRELLSGREESHSQQARHAEPLLAQPAMSASGPSTGSGSVPAARIEELSVTLEDLRDSIREMESFLKGLAARLRSHREEPVVVKVQAMPQGSSRPLED